MLEKRFNNAKLGIELTSYVDNKQNIWFQGKDIAKILGYSDTDQAIRKHVDSEDQKSFPVVSTGYSKRGRPSIFINESGFYSLVLSSKLETAKKFKKWVTSQVLPSIRKFGYYKLFKIENETREKQRVIIDGVKYYRHSVFSNYGASKNGEVINIKTGRIMNMIKRGNNYLKFTIIDKKLEKPKMYLQHRFVYEVFKGVIPRCLQIDHINNCKTDNRLKNLQLLTHKQNVEKSRNKAIISINIENGKKKVFISIKKASIELGICCSLISQICNKRNHYKSANSKKDGKKYTFVEYLS